LEGLKNGFIEHIKQSTWAEVGETRENYSVWMTDGIREFISDSIAKISFNFELRGPSMFRKGDLIKKIYFSEEYNFKIDWRTLDNNSINNKICYNLSNKNKFRTALSKSTTTLVNSVSKIFGKRIDNSTQNLTSGISDTKKIYKSDNDKIAQTPESIFVSRLLYLQLIEWILEIESGK